MFPFRSTKQTSVAETGQPAGITSHTCGSRWALKCHSNDIAKSDYKSPASETPFKWLTKSKTMTLAWRSLATPWATPTVTFHYIPLEMTGWRARHRQHLKHRTKGLLPGPFWGIPQWQSKQLVWTVILRGFISKQNRRKSNPWKSALLPGFKRPDVRK